MTKGLTKLKALTLGSNQLTGTISPEFFNDLVSLERLSLENNMIIGQLPDAFGNLPLLQEIRLGQNRLSGRIPPSLFGGNSNTGNGGIRGARGMQQGTQARTSLLTKCDLNGNLFTGELPKAISNGAPSLK